MLLTVAVAGVLAAGLALLTEDVGNVDHGATAIDVGVDLAPLSDSRFPTTAGLAATAAVLTAAAPWLSRRWRRAGWALVVGLMLTRFLATAVSFDTLSAFLLGWLSGSAMLVVLGAPSRRPSVTSVNAGLAAVGVPMQALEPASVDARGSTPYFGVTSDGEKLFVKVLGDDERSADMLFRLYRRLQPRDFGDERPFSSLRRTVEHEALVALAASELGVRTPPLRAFAAAEPNGYVLAYAAIEGRSLDRLEPEEFDDDVLAAIWALVAQLQRHRVAHRDLRLANIFRDDDGQVWLIDFGFSEMAASDLLLANDVAELTASSSLVVGAERAVQHALRAVDDPARLRLAADRMQPWALSGATRTAHKARPGLLDEVRQRVETAAASASTSA
jgi:undecaprenyl-diphosphatase